MRFTLALFAFLALPTLVVAQEEDQYEQYLFLKAREYTPAKTKADKQKLELTFDLSPDVPKGTKIEFELEHLGLPLEDQKVVYTLKDENRRGLKLTWEFSRQLAVDTYFLRTRMHPEEQTPAVRKKILESGKFLESDSPWTWYFFEEADRFEIGTPEELAAENKALCDAYNVFIGDLAKNLTEFLSLAEEVKAGKKHVNGTSLDVAGFTEAVVEWRKKQGEVQKRIATFPVDQPRLFEKKRKAHLHLEQLGQMVSKRSHEVMEEITKQYNAEPINPKSHESFNRVFRYRVDSDGLNRKVKDIQDLACKPEAEETGAEESASAEN